MVMREIRRTRTTRSALEGSNLTGSGATRDVHASRAATRGEDRQAAARRGRLVSGVSKGRSSHRRARVRCGARRAARVRPGEPAFDHRVLDRPDRRQRARRHHRGPRRQSVVHDPGHPPRRRPHHADGIGHRVSRRTATTGSRASARPTPTTRASGPPACPARRTSSSPPPTAGSTSRSPTIPPPSAASRTTARYGVPQRPDRRLAPGRDRRGW